MYACFSTRHLPFNQMPVWEEQWCPPNDPVGPSEGREDQFWANGISEPLPPPSLPRYDPRSLHLTDCDHHPQTHSNIPLQISHLSTSTAKDMKPEVTGNMGMLTQPERMPYSLPEPKKHPRLIGTSKVLHSPRQCISTLPTCGYQRMHSKEGSSTCSDELRHEFSAEQNPHSSRTSRVVSVTPPYPTSNSTHCYTDTKSPSLKSGRSFMSSAESLRSPSLQSPSTKTHFRFPEKPALHVKEIEQLGSSMVAEDAQFEGFCTRATPALQHSLGSSSLRYEQPVQRMKHSPTVHPRQPLSSPHTSDSIRAQNRQSCNFAFGQLVRTSRHHFAAPMSSDHTSLFDSSGNLPGSPNKSQPALDLHFSQTTSGNKSDTPDSSPNIVEDENGVFYCVR